MKTGINNKFPCIARWLFVVLSGFIYSVSSAQTPTDTLPGDPGITIFTLQDMNFGAFHTGTGGGTIIISNTGSRSVTGSVVALNLGIPFSQAIFEVEAPTGTIVSILNGPDAILTGSNGGTMTLRINDSSPASPFYTTVTPPVRTQVHIAGTLTVGIPQVTIPGSYTGNFFITFNQE